MMQFARSMQAYLGLVSKFIDGASPPAAPPAALAALAAGGASRREKVSIKHLPRAPVMTESQAIDKGKARRRQGARTEARTAKRERVVRIPEAADALGMRQSTLYNWCYERKIPSVKLGGVLGIREAVLDELICQAERPARKKKGNG